jgi:hypothetical protein
MVGATAPGAERMSAEREKACLCLAGRLGGAAVMAAWVRSLLRARNCKNQMSLRPRTQYKMRLSASAPARAGDQSV